MKEKLKYLRLVPLLGCVVLALLICAPLCLLAVQSVVSAAGGLALVMVWVGGPFVMAICLAFLFREWGAKMVFDVSLVLLLLADLWGVLVAALPFVGLREVFTWLPFVQYLSLTGLLGLVMVVRWGRVRVEG